ncbi:hypothetical protein [Mesorhizobium sp.]|uniref:hypothetical protein n=1 Tax=Mesorhizobium sp. TaxID=1871066 RepID=UPI000FE72E1B|nr:hypothetical protein [Mesorhizobium sp.]RWO86032.1 MAG: hypothetical protein EOQ95_23170 [Mesorhizobium sp.]
MAHDPIDTLGKATRHNMLVKAECSCGNVRYCRSADLMMVYGGGVDPLKLKFDCSRCKPQITMGAAELWNHEQARADLAPASAIALPGVSPGLFGAKSYVEAKRRQWNLVNAAPLSERQLTDLFYENLPVG